MEIKADHGVQYLHTFCTFLAGIGHLKPNPQLLTSTYQPMPLMLEEKEGGSYRDFYLFPFQIGANNDVC